MKGFPLKIAWFRASFDPELIYGLFFLKIMFMMLKSMYPEFCKSSVRKFFSLSRMFTS